jgi:hypothetical protein
VAVEAPGLNVRFGSKRKSAHLSDMSGLRLKADIKPTGRHVG